MSQTYQEAIENSNIVSRTDINGIITFVNEEFCKISGFTKEELLGSNHNIVRHPEVPKENFTLLWNTILSKKPYKTTVKNLCKDGSTVYLNTTITPILDENENIKEFIAIRYDVTQEVELKKDLEQKDKELNLLNKTLEEKVKKQTAKLLELNQTLEHRVAKEIEKNEEKQKLLFWQSRMASLGQMLANIAHQWRQPLTELTLTLFNVKKAVKKQSSKEIDKYYKESLEIINNMSKTIEDFSNFFNPNKEKEEFCLKSSIEEALAITKKMLEKNNIEINTNLEKIDIFGVSNEFSQIIINLLQNSTDAFKDKEKKKKISIKSFIDKDCAIIEFKDNAGGIEEKTLDKVFEPYFTTKHQSNGTGLGLFMSKMIIEKSLNGKMSLENCFDGINITIKLPLEK
ncbi:PAS domain-containing sensor histidine kinase [Arcobacter sp. CECT 8983]|uniref:PAS domain-containing sensor histidine kinase n=1 Tax=Arcobacter sp. CECT 8983 TaxID=2044508 RepID=UPI00100B361E|nr:PAS domain-containing sensor histidine kinase [Arcobacter sp. CECT 8983]RXJ88299.1 PAS domain-containing sensor histidine kinase [Arcobacter sp. CECT 8983]